MNARHVLAIDQGTTGTKAVVVSGDGQVIGSASTEFPQYYPRPGWVEHDPEEIWRTVTGTAERALRDARVRPGELAGIGITNQRETTVAWERPTGCPAHRAIVWQDRRTAGMCRRLTESGTGQLIHDKTGLLLDPYFSGTKIAWLLDHVDGLRKRAEAGEILFGTIDSWLVYKLTGGRVHITDCTNASRTLLMDLAEVAWDDDLLGLLHIPRQVLPEIRPSAQVYGETDRGAFLGAAVPVAGILGDQQAALFAQACFEPGQAKNSYGTGSFVLENTGHQPRLGSEKLIATVAYGIEGEPVEYALEGSVFVTGAAVQWLRDGLGIIGTAEETESLAASLDGNDDVWFVPAMAGLGAPDWDPRARGTLLGVTRGTTKAHLARAVLESEAYQTRDVVDVMCAESGEQITELRADGGAAVNGWLMQFQADILGIPVDVPEMTETTSLGSAYVAGLSTGVFADRGELQRTRRTGRRYEPQMSQDQRDGLHARWREAVKRASHWAREEA
ncbi:MAG TPA: glycerol kinase GlpK [Streptosporangiaceae bacterium]|nr:glycerol kinase GlpK [Streptosporangiaceae bacterium]